MLNEILKESLCSLAHAISSHYGESCEVVIHDLTENDAADHSIIYIENGHVTGRKIGDGASAVVLEQLSKANDPGAQDHIGYFTKSENGKILKSSTVYIKDENQNVIAIFSINHDITALSVAASSINEIIASKDNSSSEPKKITPNVSELLDSLIWESVQLIGKHASLMNKEDKIRAIRYLNDKGALLITKSGDKISKYFGISKFTLYSYIDIKQEDKND